MEGQADSWEDLADDAFVLPTQTEHGAQGESHVSSSPVFRVAEDLLRLKQLELELQAFDYEVALRVDEKRAEKWYRQQLVWLERPMEPARRDWKRRQKETMRNRSLNQARKDYDKGQAEHRQVCKAWAELKDKIQRVQAEAPGIYMKAAELIVRYEASARQYRPEEGRLAPVTHPLIEAMLIPELHTRRLQDKGCVQAQPVARDEDECLVELLRLHLTAPVYEERYHWHSSKKLGGPRKGRAKQKLLHREQDEAAILQYGVNALNAVRDSRALVDFSQSLYAATEKRKSMAADEQVKRKASSKREKAGDRKNQNQRGDSASDLSTQALNDRIQQLKREAVRIAAVGDGLLALLLQLLSLQNAWSNRLPAPGAEGYDPRATNIALVEIFNTVQDILLRCQEGLTEKVLEYLVATVQAMGFQDLAGWVASLQPRITSATAVDETLKLVYLRNHDQAASCARFQLVHRGPTMLKGVQARHCSDVDFIPDDWQYDLIQHINRDNTVLVCAPTSAGKTFSSFHAAQRTLDKAKFAPATHTKGAPVPELSARIVFLAPTNSLINHIAISLAAHLPEQRIGIFEHKQRKNLRTSTILICNPATFVILLMSPNNEEWARNLLYVVFDEVHCLATMQAAQQNRKRRQKQEGGEKEHPASEAKGKEEEPALVEKDELERTEAKTGKTRTTRRNKRSQRAKANKVSQQGQEKGVQNVDEARIEKESGEDTMRPQSQAHPIRTKRKRKRNRKAARRAAHGDNNPGRTANTQGDTSAIPEYEETPTEDKDLELKTDVNAVAYAQALALVQCPFLALSATIRSPDKLASWLSQFSSIPETSGEKGPPEPVHGNVALVPGQDQHILPWNCLKKFVFTTEDSPMTLTKKGLDVKPKQRALIPLHPFALLHDYGVADRLNLHSEHFSSDELLAFYDAMSTVLQEHGQPRLYSRLQLLAPESFFAGQWFLNKTDCYRYQSELISLFLELDDIARKKTALLLQPPTGLPLGKKRQEHEEKGEEAKAVKEGGALAKSADYLTRNIMRLLWHLMHENMFPALCFSYSNQALVKLAMHVADTLDALDPVELQSTQESKEQRAEHKRAKIAVEEPEERNVDPRQEEEKRKLQAAKHSVRNLIAYASAVNPKFSFLSRGRSNIFSQFPATEFWLLNLFQKEPAWCKQFMSLLKGLARGVAAYHSGLPRAYRELVESMLRAGVLSVVVGSDSLSVGISMPCKTVVLLQDSIYLHAESYHHMRGRAGRRGFDEVGYTVFLDTMPERKLQQLIFGELPEFVGVSALTLELVHKGIILHNQAADKLHVARLLAKMLVPPMATLASAHQRTQPHCVFRYSLEFLHAFNLIDVRGVPIGLSGLVSHLAEFVPGAYALCYLINAGAINAICEGYQPASQGRAQEAILRRKQCLRELMLCLAHIFAQKPVPATSPRRCRTLPPLPAPITAALHQYNTIERMVRENAASVFNECGLGVPNLPAYNIDHLPVPHGEEQRDAVGAPLNSYAYDFFLKKGLRDLVQNNSMDDNTAYRALAQWKNLLSKAATALENYGDSRQPYHRAFIELHNKFEHRWWSMEKAAY